MKIRSKKAAIFASAIMLTFSLVSCGSKDSSSSENKVESNLVGNVDKDVNVSSDEMPYGATYKQLDTQYDGVPIVVEYDVRFVQDEEGKLVSDYFSAISTKDGEKLKSVSYEKLMDTRIKDNNCSDIQKLAELMHDSFATEHNIGSDFTFNFLSMQDYKKEDSGFDFSVYDNAVLAADPNAKINSKAAVPVYIMYSDSEANGRELITPENGAYTSMGVDVGDPGYVWICIYNIDGKYYVIY
ncbi:MAG: hypothetical protein IJM38_08560 [Ruminococcus sp.]|nr:hypothetical protein [Ruminococcus sp.]